MQTRRLNDQERENWIMNDEALYLWWKTSRMGITTFVRAKRVDLDKYILGQLNKKPSS